MTRVLGVGLALVLLLPAGASAQAQRNAPERRALQARVVDRFMDRAAERLRLDASQRRRLEDAMRQNEGRRRALAREAVGLRQRLAQAVDDANVPESEIQRMLDQMADLRRRELDLWQDEQRSLAGVLGPRQRAQFMVMRLQFTEMVQRMRRERRDGPFADPPRRP
ncbi:MAG TPA: hypothetical protein VFS33_05490 [Gemmatimonadales bacterium]|nr:hypothetical protein [Gemmatimonadales bacterium]